MTVGSARVLLIGYGNPGRLDDGLGPALAERLAKRGIPGLEVEADYQLTIEDAAAVAAADVAILADASLNGPEPFGWERLERTAEPSFTSHGVEPPELLGLVRGLFGAQTSVYVLGIRGYRFDAFGETLSEGAEANLNAAVAFVEARIRSGVFETPAVEKGDCSP